MTNATSYSSYKILLFRMHASSRLLGSHLLIFMGGGGVGGRLLWSWIFFPSRAGAWLLFFSWYGPGFFQPKKSAI